MPSGARLAQGGMETGVHLLRGRLRRQNPTLCRQARLQAWCATTAAGQQQGPSLPPPCRQWYTDLPANLAVRRGSLVLQAVRDSNPGTAPQYTSARVRTFGQFGVAPSAAYPLIRIQARIKVPQGLGLWSAFW